MTLEHFIHTLEACVFDLGKHLWSEDPVGELQEQADRLSAALQQHRAALVECQARVAELRSRLAWDEKQAVVLAQQVQAYLHVNDRVRAWEHALELDRLRHSLHEDRPKLRSSLLACREHQNHIDHLERSLAGVQDKLYRIRQGYGQQTPVAS
jgi:hypothetical protein